MLLEGGAKHIQKRTFPKLPFPIINLRNIWSFLKVFMLSSFFSSLNLLDSKYLLSIADDRIAYSSLVTAFSNKKIEPSFPIIKLFCKPNNSSADNPPIFDIKGQSILNSPYIDES